MPALFFCLWQHETPDFHDCRNIAFACRRESGKKRAILYIRFIRLSCKNNLNNRSIELEVIPACRHYGLGLLPWNPLDGVCWVEPSPRRKADGATLLPNGINGRFYRHCWTTASLHQTKQEKTVMKTLVIVSHPYPGQSQVIKALQQTAVNTKNQES